MILRGIVMSLLGFGGNSAPKKDFIGSDIGRALELNERAGECAREALEDLLDRGRLRRDLTDIVGKL